jgi:HPt (histidine-containing phosphotransfer) domain-containing protein
MAAPGSAAAGEASQDAGTAIIDKEHLERMTLGDRELEREVLQLFVRQTAMMLYRIVDAEPAKAAAIAHSLIGSARGIGAWRVAHAAEWVERAAGEASEDQLSEATVELKAASLEASAAIGARLSDRTRYASHGSDPG